MISHGMATGSPRPSTPWTPGHTRAFPQAPGEGRFHFLSIESPLLFEHMNCRGSTGACELTRVCAQARGTVLWGAGDLAAQGRAGILQMQGGRSCGVQQGEGAVPRHGAGRAAKAGSWPRRASSPPARVRRTPGPAHAAGQRCGRSHELVCSLRSAAVPKDVCTCPVTG